MGIRPFIAIKQTIGNTAANIASSTMKGMIVGPSIQAEKTFKSEVNVSQVYGALSSIMGDAATGPKVINTVGLKTGGTLIDGSLSFGVGDASAVLEFTEDYKATIKSTSERHILKVDITSDNSMTIDTLLSSGAENGDLLEVGISDDDTVTYVEHKIRKFDVVDNDGTTELYIYLWDEVTEATDETTELLLVEKKELKTASVSILAPLEVKMVAGSKSAYTIDNSSSPTDGAFTATIYVYEPIGSPDGVTFENRFVSTVELTTLSNYTKTSKIVKIGEGSLYNFFEANRTDLSNNIFEVNEYNYVTKLGEPTRENKLSYAMKLICKEVPGASMKVYVTEDDSYNGYKKALGAIATSGTVYSVSVLTDDEDVLNEVENMVNLASSENVAKWKMGIISPRTPHFSEVISLSDYTIEGGQVAVDNFLVTSATGGFLSSGLNVGDFVFSKTGLEEAGANYYSGYGETYSGVALGTVVEIITDKKAMVKAITPSQDLVAKLSGENAVFGELNSNNELADKVKERSLRINSKGVVSIFPDKISITDGEEEVLLPSFFAASVLNGVMAHLPPQQGLSNLSLPSFKRVIGSSFTFTDGELDEIASAGTLVLLQEDNSSAPYILRQLTTKMDSLESMEINKVRCLDYATLAFAGAITGYVGKRNVSSENAIELKDELKSAGELIVDTTKITHLGSIITSYTIVDVAIPDTERDAINAVIEVETPTSLNKVRLFVSSGEIK